MHFRLPIARLFYHRHQISGTNIFLSRKMKDISDLSRFAQCTVKHVIIPNIHTHVTESKINARATRVATLEVCVPTHIALGMFIMQVLAMQ